MAGIVQSTGTLFAVGFLFGTSDANGTTISDNVPFGQLQEFTLKDGLSLKELMGNTGLTAVSVATSERKITGEAKFAVIKAAEFNMLRGVSGVYQPATNTTLLTSLQTDEPHPFNVHLKTPGDGSGMELLLYNCVSPELQMGFKLRDYVIPSFTVNVYGDPVSGKVWDILLPGNQALS